jgi:MarR family transcriptional regulator, negative regulator of the multidrug operon emrRAB
MHDSGDVSARLANVLGAVALAATGAMTAAAAAVTEGGLSAAAGLVTLASEPGIGVTELSRRLGLSQPGTTRLVEALAQRGLVLSEPAPGARAVSLRLTRAGGEKARLILDERERALTALLAPLDSRARGELDAALSLVLDRLTADGAPPNRTCRLCDEQACVAAAPCPVDQAWRRGGQRC